MNSAPPSPMPYSPRRKKPFFKRAGVRILLLMLVVGGGYYFYAHHKTSDVKGPAAAPVRVAPAEKKKVPVTINAVGTVVAYETVAIRSRLDSQVVAVNFKDGDEVKAGDVLFQLDDKALKAQAQELQANINRDRANLDNAKRQYDRAQELAKQGYATKATRDDTYAAYQAAEAGVGASVAALDNVKVQLGYTRITAPISGRTGTINVTLGNTVKANDTQPLVTINQIKPIRVQSALAQNYVDTVRQAMKDGEVAVNVTKQDGDGEILATGRLEYIDNNIDQATSTFATRAGFANEDERLWPGMFVTTRITLGEDENALTIPEVAVQHGQNGDYVFVIINQKALRRDITVARLQDNLAVISKGLEAGELVATDGLLGLKDGVTVAIQTDTKPVAPATTITPASAQVETPAPAPVTAEPANLPPHIPPPPTAAPAAQR